MMTGVPKKARGRGAFGDGFAVLLVLLILSALLSIGLSIFTVVFGQIRLSAEMNDSFIAFSAATEGFEKYLYMDLIADSVSGCMGTGACSHVNTINLANGACIYITMTRVNIPFGQTALTSTGEFRCGAASNLPVRRAIRVNYQK